MPNVDQAAVQVDTANALLAAARVLVAAHVQHDETGAWPADAKALGPRLGGAPPADPFRPASGVQFAVVGGEARAWSVGVNGTDEQGATRASGMSSDAGDVVLVSPAQSSVGSRR